MRALLTGAAGLIGMAVRPLLESRGYTVVATDVSDIDHAGPELHRLSLSDTTAMEGLVRDHALDAVVHCGAISGPMMAKGDPLRLVGVNIDATAALLDIARRYAMQRFVFCSSIGVYGDVGDAVITEATPLRPTSVYGATKVACEQLIQGFEAEYALEGISLRIGRVYGPYRRANCRLKSMIAAVRTGERVEIPCDPTFVYHYVSVDDVAEAIVAALEAPRLPDRAYNVGSGEPLTMPDLVAQARRALPGLDVALVPGADDVPDRQAAFDVSAIGRDLEWRPRFVLRGGSRPTGTRSRRGGRRRDGFAPTRTGWPPRSRCAQPRGSRVAGLRAASSRRRVAGAGWPALGLSGRSFDKPLRHCSTAAAWNSFRVLYTLR